MKARDLTLADFVGWIRETKPGHLQTVVHRDQPFAAILRKAPRPTRQRTGELVIVQPGTYPFERPDAAYLRFLRQQFPSLHRRYRKGSEANKHWWMNDKDFALMRVFFGGRE